MVAQVVPPRAVVWLRMGRSTAPRQPPGQWEIMHGDFRIEGPFREEDLLSAIESGEVFWVRIRRVGTEAWQSLTSYESFAAAWRRALRTRPPQ